MRVNDNDVAMLGALFWKSPLTIRFGLGVSFLRAQD